MRTAILGWGSLIWEGGNQFDGQHFDWHYDGPSMKLEFSRISSTRMGALTLVSDLVNGSLSTVAWCLSKRDNPLDAICDLRCREGTVLQNIGRIFTQSPKRNYSHEKRIRRKIISWARLKNFDAVVWTDLQSNYAEKRGDAFSVQAALAYLQNLPPEAKVKAVEYIRNAPAFVQTPLRVTVNQQRWFTEIGN